MQQRKAPYRKSRLTQGRKRVEKIFQEGRGPGVIILYMSTKFPKIWPHVSSDRHIKGAQARLRNGVKRWCPRTPANFPWRNAGGVVQDPMASCQSRRRALKQPGARWGWCGDLFHKTTAAPRPCLERMLQEAQMLCPQNVSYKQREWLTSASYSGVFSYF